MKKFIFLASTFLLGGMLNAQIDYTLSPNSSNLEGARSSSVIFADVNNDGALDLFVTGKGQANSDPARLYMNDGTGDFTEATGVPFPTLFQAASDTADVNGDGAIDILITGRNLAGHEYASLYLNDGNGNFTEDTNVPFTPVAYSAVAFADVDGDGDYDVLISGDDGNNKVTKLYLNDGTGTFTEDMGASFPGLYYASIAFEDIDGDGAVDLVLSGRQDPGPYITKLYYNDGNGNFTEDTNTSLSGLMDGSVVVADLTGNNAPDIIVSGWGGPTTKYYTNDGNGNFTEETNTGFVGVWRSSIKAVDVDGDGDLDLLITGRDAGANSVTEFYENDGAGNFTEVTSLPFVDLRESSAAFGDVNGNGRLDLFLSGRTNASGETVVGELYLNNTCITTYTTDTVEACESYTWVDGNEYTVSTDSETFTFQDAYGCDSIVTLDLTIKPNPNTDTYVTGETIYSEEPNGTYNWLDCDDNFAPVGVTTQEFTPTENGNYAVEVTVDGCVDTSECVSITTVGLEDYKLDEMKAYPNPTTGTITLVSSIEENVTVEIVSVDGKVIRTFEMNKSKTINLPKENGVYFIKVQFQDRMKTIKAIKQ